MSSAAYASCIKSCYECAATCDLCAAACLGEDDVKMMARCISLDIDCGQMCRTAAAMMARDSAFASQLCAVCADICQACGDECAKHSVDHCQNCARMCRACAEECRRMAA